jgi:hypothetical protein
MNPHHATMPTLGPRKEILKNFSHHPSFAICTRYKEKPKPHAHPNHRHQHTRSITQLVQSRESVHSASLNTSVLRAAAYMRPIIQHFRRRLVLILFEVLHEQPTQLLNLGSEVRGTVPRFRRVKQLVGDVGTRFGYGEAEGIVCFEFDFGELAGVDGVEDGAGVFKGAALGEFSIDWAKLMK